MTSVIVPSSMRQLDDQMRKDLLALHQACKAAKNSNAPYEFEWLLGLLNRPTTLYVVDIQMGAATVTFCSPDNDLSALLARLSP